MHTKPSQICHLKLSFIASKTKMSYSWYATLFKYAYASLHGQHSSHIKLKGLGLPQITPLLLSFLGTPP